MLFTSSVFLFGFLPVLLAVYYLIPRSFRNFVLLVASLLFYAWGQLSGLLLLPFSIGVNYLAGRGIERSHGQGKPGKWPLWLGISFNLLFLGTAKYTFFAVENANLVLASLGMSEIRIKPFGLLLGISFFTFHAISYLVDIYSRRATAQKGVINYGLYIALFPQLIAGPIIRYRDIADQLIARHVTVGDLTEGICIFLVGLAKKLMIANVLGIFADETFSGDARYLSTSTAWLAVLCYTGQIYFDFSGYSDMARGLCRLFGFRIIDNFNYPYVSQSVQEFWRRWHISLSNWFRDYLYIPLGGNRLGRLRTTVNLFVVFFLCGLWHGAHWNFVLWGLYQGVFLALERLSAVRTVLDGLGRFGRHAYLLLVVQLGWVLFRTENLDQAAQYYRAMFGMTPGTEARTPGVSFALIVVICIAAVAATPALYSLHRNWQERVQGGSASRVAYELLMTTWFLALFGACVSLVAMGAYNPFIYFSF